MEQKQNSWTEILKRLKKEHPELSPAKIRNLAKKQIKADKIELKKQLKALKKKKSEKPVKQKLDDCE